MCMLLACLMTLTIVGPVSAVAAEDTYPVVGTQPEDTPTPRADHLLYYYRIYNGVPQYRIWNATDGYWVTDWIDL